VLHRRTKYTLVVYQTILAKRTFRVVLERLEGSSISS
jgi:hypothetical protein